MIKNVIFDFGGVIVDISRTSAVKKFQSIGVTNAEDLLDKYHQKGIFLEVEDGRIDAEEFRRKLSEQAGKEITLEECRQGWLGFFVGLPSYRLECLEELRKSYNLYALSNTNPFVKSWARSKDFTPAGKPLDDYFDKLYLSYEIGLVKPDKRFFEYMIRDAGLNPAESVFVDDGSANIQMAKELGFVTVQAINGEDWRDMLAEALR